jgi:lipopolysaccharide biosynthesis glycosyltransferase
LVQDNHKKNVWYSSFPEISKSCFGTISNKNYYNAKPKSNKNRNRSSHKKTEGQKEIMTMTSGIIYITYGKKYVEAAIYSAKSARRHCPDLNIHLFVDAPNYKLFQFEKETFPFTSVELIENPHRRSKVDCISKTPFDRTLYLDSDTTVAQDIREIFNVLDRFDIAATQAMHRNSKSHREYWNIQLPNAFPQFNSGVLLFRKTAHVTELLENWSAAFSDSKLRHDQPTLRELLWLSDLRLYALPPEYNVRFLKYKFIWNKTEAVPMIYHLKQYHKGWGKWVFVRIFKGPILATRFIIKLLLKVIRIKIFRKDKLRKLKTDKSNH